MEVESEGIQLQAKGHHQTWQVTPGRQERGMEPPPSEPSEEVSPADALVSEFWPPEERENTLSLFGHATRLVGS